MTLPNELQQRFEEQLTRYQEERKMPLLSTMELRAMQKGSLPNNEDTQKIESDKA